MAAPRPTTVGVGLRSGVPIGAPQGRSGRLLFSCCVVIFLLVPPSAFSQRELNDLASEYKSKDRSISDIVLDVDGNLHIAWRVIESPNHESGTLFYTRLDSSGRVSTESQITRFGGAYDIRLDVDSRNRAAVFYRQLNRLCLALFDETGTMRTAPDRYLTDGETDARFVSCRDESDNLIVVGRGTIDYFWKLGPSGEVLAERRGRWLRAATPGFVCQLASPAVMVFVWGVDSVLGPAHHQQKFRMLKFDLSSFSPGESREYDFSKVAEARVPGILLSQTEFIRSGRDLLLFASVNDSASEAVTYRVRFNFKGEPVRRWEGKRIYHLEVSNPRQGHCAYRTGLLVVRRGNTRVLDLQGLGTDGNIYNMTGRVPALRHRQG